MNMPLKSRVTARSLLFLLLTVGLASPAMGTDVFPTTLAPPTAVATPTATYGSTPTAPYGSAAADPLGGGHTGDGGNRNRIVLTGMTVLGGWGVVNIASGLTGTATANDPAHRGFWEMNAMWNTVNLGIAAWSLYDLTRSQGQGASAGLMDPGDYREESHSLEKVLLFNAGLNFAYMAVGGWMWDRGNGGEGLAAADISSERLTGWGRSMVMQGAFLLAFDLTMARVVAQDRRRTAP